VIDHPVIRVLRKEFKKRMRTPAIAEQIIHFLYAFRKELMYHPSVIFAFSFQRMIETLILQSEFQIILCFSFLKTSRLEDD